MAANKADNDREPAMRRAVKLYEKSSMTLEELGKAMGSGENTAKKSAWQFLYQTKDPRISTLRKFAKAIGVPLEELVKEGAK